MSLAGRFYWLNTFIIIRSYSYPSHFVCLSVTPRLIPPWGPLTTSPLRSSCRLDTTSCATGGLWGSSCMKCSSVRHTAEKFIRSLGCKQNRWCMNKPAVLRHHEHFFFFLKLSVLFRLPTLLLRDATGDLQEGDELEGDPCLPAWSPHLWEGQRLDIEVCSDLSQKVEELFKQCDCSAKVRCSCVSGIALMLRTGSGPWAWRRSRVISSLSRWTGSTSGTKSSSHTAMVQKTVFLTFIWKTTKVSRWISFSLSKLCLLPLWSLPSCSTLLVCPCALICW